MPTSKAALHVDDRYDMVDVLLRQVTTKKKRKPKSYMNGEINTMAAYLGPLNHAIAREIHSSCC
jgi:hypothetical protein